MARAQTWTAWNRDEHANYAATAPPMLSIKIGDNLLNARKYKKKYVQWKWKPKYPWVPVLNYRMCVQSNLSVSSKIEFAKVKLFIGTLKL